MDKEVAAADAYRWFSELLRTVKTGQSIVVTRHGMPVAKITPQRKCFAMTASISES